VMLKRRYETMQGHPRQAKNPDSQSRNLPFEIRIPPFRLDTPGRLA
jgi:uncharacterized protein affecting Mg2+/Co2+ transport